MASGERRKISQAAFDGLVAENVNDLGMDPEEAVQDAIETLTLQGVDLSGIVKCGSAKENPVIQALDLLKKKNADEISGLLDSKGEEFVELLSAVVDLCSAGGPENASIAAENGAVELLTSICGTIHDEHTKALVSALRALGAVLYDFQSTGTFFKIGGPKIVMDILRRKRQNHECLEAGLTVVVKAATGNEILKEAFMELNIGEFFVEIMKEKPEGSGQNLYEAIRVVLTPDDNRVAASQVYGYARRFAKIGIAEALVDALQANISSSNMVSLCSALKAVGVNEEICRAISEGGGLDAILDCLDASSYDRKAIAKACCSLLCKLAGSDANKTAIIMKDGLSRLIKLSSKYPDDASVLQEIMAVISVLSLRSSENAARAVEAGAGDLAIKAMQRFPTAYQLQRQGCQMVRNLVARNSDNRAILLGNGIEKIIRKAKASHESCRDAATDALRDLGLDNYNT